MNLIYAPVTYTSYNYICITYTYIYTHIHTYIYIYTCVHVYIYMYTCVHVYIYMYIYIYIRAIQLTYTHMDFIFSMMKEPAILVQSFVYPTTIWNLPFLYSCYLLIYTCVYIYIYMDYLY